ncbi:MAG: molybdate ABC transporter substrate-binding protein [Pseudomonadota bacterium]
MLVSFPRIALSVLLLLTVTASADVVRVGVAANFVAALTALQPDFERRSGHRLQISAGSTGLLYAQIVNGAPFDVFLAADQQRPALLVESGRALADSRLTYAVGRLVLFSADKKPSADTLGGEVGRLAIANPKLAPYGRAAADVLQRFGLNERLGGRIALSQNVAAAYAAAATRNVDLAFVALAHVRTREVPPGGGYWLVPAAWHTPIRQDAVRLIRSNGNVAAGAFMEYLADPATRARLQRFGYEFPAAP